MQLAVMAKRRESAQVNQNLIRINRKLLEMAFHSFHWPVARQVRAIVINQKPEFLTDDDQIVSIAELTRAFKKACGKIDVALHLLGV